MVIDALAFAGDTERRCAVTIWLHTYNHDGSHSALGGQVAGGPQRV